MKIQMDGVDDPVLVEHKLRADKRKTALMKRPTKALKDLTPKERDAAIDAMLEWWMNQEG